jgi:hypothetical protein
MTNTTATALEIITDWSDLGSWIGLCTGNPGSTTSPANEVSGGSPAYARKETGWVVSGATAIGTPVTINVPAGTYSFIILCSGSSGNNVVDWASMTPQVCTEQTTLTITPLATAS